MALDKYIIGFTTAPATTPAGAILTYDGKAWNTSGTPALEAYASANYANYPINLTQLGTSRYWYLSIPSTLPPGIYAIPITTPVVSSTPVQSTDTILAIGLLDWDGASVHSEGGLVSDSGTAQSGAAGTITIRSGAPSTTDYFKNCAVKIVSGTGAGQVRKVASQAGAVLTVDVNWVTNPDSTSVYKILGRIV